MDFYSVQDREGLIGSLAAIARMNEAKLGHLGGGDRLGGLRVLEGHPFKLRAFARLVSCQFMGMYAGAIYKPGHQSKKLPDAEILYSEKVVMIEMKNIQQFRKQCN